MQCACMKLGLLRANNDVDIYMCDCILLNFKRDGIRPETLCLKPILNYDTAFHTVATCSVKRDAIPKSLLNNWFIL